VSDLEQYRVGTGEQDVLDRIDPDDDGGMRKEDGRAAFKKLSHRLVELQRMLYADGGRGLLVVLQAMDAGGKDSTIRAVFGPLNPQGCRVVSFKGPTDEELRHDFLWRIHHHAPPAGYITVFNRSHYEDVLIVRVKDLVPERRWRPRYEHINAFEKLITDEGTVLVKFMLHISKGYQRERLQRRLDRPDKQWKFNPDDLAERARWGEYQQAFNDALSACSTAHAPWYVIPAERRWYRNYLVTRILVSTIEGLELSYPKPDYDPSTIEIP
jgi:PPK2 family polyphosphate:nucleotide phosphotransferase